jgi:carboxylate-amine ligase
MTIGVEEEYQIVDPVTRQLSSSADLLFAKAQRQLGEHVQVEMQLSQIEIATPVCDTLADVRKEVARLRGEMISLAAQSGKKLLSTGSHPFSRWQEQRITPKKRYQLLEHDYQQLAREQVICGCHIHVGVDDQELAIQTMNRMRAWLGPFLALTANSPFWVGEDTGYASFRTEVWSRWPTSGPPPVFASWNEYQELVQALISAGCLEDTTKVYWDIRPSGRFHTIELRLSDACLTMDETIMVAGLARALVQSCYKQVVQNIPTPVVHPDLARFAHWHAARYGLSHTLIDVIARRALPAQRVIEQFLTFLQPALEIVGDWESISSLVQETLQRGNGAARQREVYRRTGCMEDLVDYIIEETEQGIR